MVASKSEDRVFEENDASATLIDFDDERFGHFCEFHSPAIVQLWCTWILYPFILFNEHKKNSIDLNL